MQLNKSFLAIGNGQTDRRTDGITDICDSRVAFATEKGYKSQICFRIGIHILIFLIYSRDMHRISFICK